MLKSEGAFFLCTSRNIKKFSLIHEKIREIAAVFTKYFFLDKIFPSESIPTNKDVHNACII